MIQLSKEEIGQTMQESKESILGFDKKDHRFFERYLDNDLEDLYNFLIERNQDIFDGKFPGIEPKKAEGQTLSKSIATSLSPYYNIFQLYHPGIYSLYEQVKSMTEEACEYYRIDFKSQKYMLQGWFNCDSKSIPTINNLHDHDPDTGAPYFHGYYCVNAEPSITKYKINKETFFDNQNINNRAILSETGHPHRKSGWASDKKRITIAYDMVPLSLLEKNNLDQHWIPLI